VSLSEVAVTTIQIEGAIGAFYLLAFGGISALQALKAKVYQPKCFVCGHDVQHQEQAHDVPFACHDQCRWKAKALEKILTDAG